MNIAWFVMVNKSEMDTHSSNLTSSSKMELNLFYLFDPQENVNFFQNLTLSFSEIDVTSFISLHYGVHF